MQFYVPWTERNQLVTESVPPGTTWVDVSGGPTAYYDALAEIWSKGEDFAIIEHDVVIHGAVVEEFESCLEPWCLFSYDNMCHEACREAWANMLGCTRFRAEVMEACPDVFTSMTEDLRGWHNLCDHMAGNKLHGTESPLRPSSIRAAGFTHHWHSPPVGHHPWFACR